MNIFSAVNQNKKFKPAHDKIYNKTCARSEDSVQPAHPRRLIRVFADRMCFSTRINSKIEENFRLLEVNGLMFFLVDEISALFKTDVSITKTEDSYLHLFENWCLFMQVFQFEKKRNEFNTNMVTKYKKRTYALSISTVEQNFPTGVIHDVKQTKKYTENICILYFNCRTEYSYWRHP